MENTLRRSIDAILFLVGSNNISILMAKSKKKKKKNIHFKTFKMYDVLITNDKIDCCQSRHLYHIRVSILKVLLSLQILILLLDYWLGR